MSKKIIIIILCPFLKLFFFFFPFSFRVESFIEHQDSCTVRSLRPELQALQVQPPASVSATATAAAASSSRTASSTSPSSDANFSNHIHHNNTTTTHQGILNLPNKPIIMSTNIDHPPIMLVSTERSTSTSCNNNDVMMMKSNHRHDQHFLELQLLPSSSSSVRPSLHNSPDENFSTRLKLSIGTSSPEEKAIAGEKPSSSGGSGGGGGAEEVVKAAMAEKAYAEEARREAKRQIEIAEVEFANAKRIRQQAQGELEKAQLLREQATKRISSTILQITCQACKQQFQTTPFHASATAAPDETTSLAMSYISSATTEGEGE